MGQDQLPTILEKNLGSADLTIEELVLRANELLARVAPRQTRYKVSERPDIRTIRYYISQKLLPKPVSYEGGKARFAGPHLLRLLAIKKMQASHQTLRQISRVLGAASDQQVLQFLLDTASSGDPTPEPSAPPLRIVQAAEAAAPTETVAGQAMRRMPLALGATLDVPEDVLSDPAQRRRLAQSLESLTQKLRQTPRDHGDSADSTETEGEDS